MKNDDNNLQEDSNMIRWFSQQARTVQADILGLAFKIDNTQAFDRLIAAVRKSGYLDEKTYKTGRTISENAARKMYDRRRAQGLECISHRRKVNKWLGVNIIKIKDLRETGLSWRRLSVFISDKYKISISHTTLCKFFKRYI
jgi:hypothetical protein